MPSQSHFVRQLSQRESPWHVGQVYAGRAKHDVSGTVVRCCQDSRQLDKVRCPEAAGPVSEARAFAPYRASGVQLRVARLASGSPFGSNGDDRRQRRKQGGAVGAAASRMRAAAKQTLGAATRAVSPKVTERASPARKSRCAAMVRFPFVQPLSLAALDSSPSRGASGETVHFAGTAKASPTRGGGTKCRRGCTKDSLTMDEKLNFLRSRLAKKRSSE